MPRWSGKLWFEMLCSSVLQKSRDNKVKHLHDCFNILLKILSFISLQNKKQHINSSPPRTEINRFPVHSEPRYCAALIFESAGASVLVSLWHTPPNEPSMLPAAIASPLKSLSVQRASLQGLYPSAWQINPLWSSDCKVWKSLVRGETHEDVKSS